MARVTYVSHDGKKKTLDITPGTTIMQAAMLDGIDGIVAECGGSCMCATCHVYVQEDQLSLLPPISADEEAMLEGTVAPRQPNSRLSCQLPVTPAMDGLVVTMPETQT
jgi:2Fe-2S ferredoxin